MSKPLVQYVGEAVAVLVKDDLGELRGVVAYLIPLNHISPAVVNDEECRTSLVQRWNYTTGRIETVNTIYEKVPLPWIPNEAKEKDDIPAESSDLRQPELSGSGL